ncbi:MAG: SpoIIIAH-like family protein [Oscillospiraceae bacterium]|nr:SpoIIIAH-like family protein [Oscillospiraceae bacterium]
MKLWKRNAVVVAIVLFVGAAVYLNWSYNNRAVDDPVGESAGGKVLGQSELVNGNTDDKASGNETPVSGTEDEKGTGYFATARLNRQQARDSALELLQQAAGDEKADQAMIDEANQSIQVMAAYTMAEAQVENLVTAKGYGDCICFINDSSASVVVSATSGGLNEGDVAKITEIVSQESGLKAAQIRIIETEP